MLQAHALCITFLFKNRGFPYTTPRHYSENPYLITSIFWIVPLGLYTENSGFFSSKMHRVHKNIGEAHDFFNNLVQQY